MKTYRIIIMSLLALACTTMQAQEIEVVDAVAEEVDVNPAFYQVFEDAQKKGITILTICSGIWTACPDATIDPKTKKKVVVWQDTENNSWHEDMGMIDNVPVVEDVNALFPDLGDLQMSNEESLMPMLWQLNNEGGETVLHCYFRMPADIVKNFWLCSDECVILDKETGVIYQSRRAVPDCYGKVFSVQGKKGTFLDFQIFFPQLPETTTDICIYGVPNWFLRGIDATINRIGKRQRPLAPRFDEIPQFHKPHLISEAKNYDNDNFKSWAVYDQPHLITPTIEGTMAIWLTPEATYLARAYELNWNREYFGINKGNLLIDSSGHQYKLNGVLDYPKGPIFWVEGSSGDYFTIVQVFEPLPLGLNEITYISPEGEPFAMWGADWEGEVLTNLNIKSLQVNQKLFEYHERQKVK